MARLLAGAHFRARVCISPESPKLETTRSLARKRGKRKENGEIEKLVGGGGGGRGRGTTAMPSVVYIKVVNKYNRL